MKRLGERRDAVLRRRASGICGRIRVRRMRSIGRREGCFESGEKEVQKLSDMVLRFGFCIPSDIINTCPFYLQRYKGTTYTPLIIN